RAAQSTYTQVVSRITLDEGAQETPDDENVLSDTAATAWVQSQVDRLLALPPDVVLLAGGVDNGPVAPLIRLAYAISGAAREQSRRAELAARVSKSAPGVPIVFYAGNPAAQERVSATLSSVSETRS